eukprot:XP_001710014.1 Hypothetical protein GL50803_35026 [Giardia lamblia ATCC 50803]
MDRAGPKVSWCTKIAPTRRRILARETTRCTLTAVHLLRVD